MKIFKFIILVTLSCAINCATVAQTVQNPNDTTTITCTDDGTRFQAKQLIAPAALVTAGTVLAIDYKHGLNKTVDDWVDDDNDKIKLDEVLRFVPSAAYLALGATHIKAKHPFKERLAVFATSHMAMVALGYGLKGVVKEHRPDGSDNHAFPSGHTATAFTGAELLREEYGTAMGIAGYTVATAEAFLRIYNHKHWLGDVVMGAGIGVLSARIGYWLLPCERRLFGWDNKKSPAMVSAIPVYDASTRSMGMALVAQF